MTAVDEYDYDYDAADTAAWREHDGGCSGQDDAAAEDLDSDEYTVRLGPIYCRSLPIKV